MSARHDYPKAHANTSGPSHAGQTSRQTQAALDEIDRLRKINSEMVCSHNDINLVQVLIRADREAMFEHWRDDVDQEMTALRLRIVVLESAEP